MVGLVDSTHPTDYSDGTVPELRRDWLSGRTVIVAEERAARPNEFGEAALGAFAVGRPGGRAIPAADFGDLSQIESASSACPFCPGQEHRTPPATYAQTDEQGRWQVRVVPNMYPAVTHEAVATSGSPVAAIAGELPAFLSFVTASPAVGVQEVIVESPRHVGRTSLLAPSELRDVLEAYGERLRHWRDDGRWRYGLVFKNQGPRAGASLVHLHSQLVALPAVPPAVLAELCRSELDTIEHESCPYCRLIRHERSCGERIVLDRDGYVAFCPFASWQPYEVWLLPSDHRPSFEQPCDWDAMHQLAEVLGELIGRVETLVPEASYNLLLRTAPWMDGIEPWCHWRIEILPRMVSFAGLELAAGIHINPLSPEHGAQQLRTA